MRDAGIGRVLVASLHQGIVDRLPDRLEFYENWLNPQGLRDGTIGLAPLNAVLSFLRTEGDAYEAVTRRAGAYAADWTIDQLPAWHGRLLAWMPRVVRRAMAMRVARSLVHAAYTGSRATVRIRRDLGGLSIRSSIFCGVRDRATHPLCYFYASAVERVLARLDITASTSLTACQAEGDAACHVEVRMGVGAPVAEAAVGAPEAPSA